MTTLEQQKMMLDIDGIFTHHEATPTDLLTAAQAIAVSAIGDLVNKDLKKAASPSGNDALHRLADGIADQIRTAMHMRVNAGWHKDW
jgi:hypothetical protein